MWASITWSVAGGPPEDVASQTPQDVALLGLRNVQFLQAQPLLPLLLGFVLYSSVEFGDSQALHLSNSPGFNKVQLGHCQLRLLSQM